MAERVKVTDPITGVEITTNSDSPQASLWGARNRSPRASSVPDGEPSESWTVDQLKTYAAENDIDLGDATKKADILAAVSGESSDGE